MLRSRRDPKHCSVLFSRRDRIPLLFISFELESLSIVVYYFPGRILYHCYLLFLILDHCCSLFSRRDRVPLLGSHTMEQTRMALICGMLALISSSVNTSSTPASVNWSGRSISQQTNGWDSKYAYLIVSSVSGHHLDTKPSDITPFSVCNL